jgi:rare lipoprotein A
MTRIKLNIIYTIFTLLLFTIGFSQQSNKENTKEKAVKPIEAKENIKVVSNTKVDTTKFKVAQVLKEIDTIAIIPDYKFSLLKKKAHASYYHNKFNGRKTASGKKFDNKGYTAAHKKLPFGTKVKVTNEVNGKSVIVEINDRGPFSKAREIDLTHRAFLDITHNKHAGVLYVTLEIVEEK